MPDRQKVSWPTANDDLSEPVEITLRRLELLEDRGTTDNPRRVNVYGGTPPGLEAISSGATSFAKVLVTLIGAVTGGGGIITAVTGLLDENTGAPLTLQEKLAYIGSVTFLVCAGAISVALIVIADLAARSRATAAEYAARSQVASTMMTTPSYGRPQVPPPAYVEQERLLIEQRIPQ